MSTDQIWRIESDSPAETLAVARRIGQKLRGGEVFELVSDLGGGKTTFVRGLAEGLGSHGAVRSPSFTLMNRYPSSDLTLYHLDFYRLSEPGVMERELAEVLEDKTAITAVEWAQSVHDVLPDNHIVVTFKAFGEQQRELSIKLPTQFSYLRPTNT